MKRGRSRYTVTAILLSVLVGGWVALSACSNQSEGERCDFSNNDDDCKTDEGLVCFPKAQLSAPYNNADRCCPRDRSLATTDPCRIPTGAADAGQTPADTGPAPDVQVDTGSADTGTDAGGDAGSDAADAANDG